MMKGPCLVMRQTWTEHPKLDVADLLARFGTARRVDVITAGASLASLPCHHPCAHCAPSGSGARLARACNCASCAAVQARRMARTVIRRLQLHDCYAMIIRCIPFICIRCCPKQQTGAGLIAASCALLTACSHAGGSAAEAAPDALPAVFHYRWQAPLAAILDCSVLQQLDGSHSTKLAGVLNDLDHTQDALPL